MNELPYAENINYWRTTKSSSDKVMDNVEMLLSKLDGIVHVRAFGKEGNREAFLLEFTLDGQRYRIVWPVLPTKTFTSSVRCAARVQAAVMIYHDVKAKLVSALVQGTRRAFFNYLLLPNGIVASDIASQDLLKEIPQLLTPTIDVEIV